jgi:hypothetical protein
MSQPSHIYASTVRRRRAVWPFVVVVVTALGGFALLALALL